MDNRIYQHFFCGAPQQGLCLRHAADDAPRSCVARGKKFGLQTMCEGGGMANVTILEIV
jgi:acetyl-CoA acetyltransferase